jgi:hypothetical protein
MALRSNPAGSTSTPGQSTISSPVPAGSRAANKSDTESMIEAVFENRNADDISATVIGHASTSTRMPGRLGVILATTIGKIILCTTVAAASIGGVYATTDAIQLTSEVEPNVGDPAGPVVVDEPEVAEAPQSTDPATTAGSEDDESDNGGERDPVEEAVEREVDAELEGCERGQAIAEEAASNNQGQGHNPDFDPCTRSEQAGNGNSNGNGNNDSATTEPTTEAPIDPAPEHPGQPAHSGSPGNSGKKN